MRRHACRFLILLSLALSPLPAAATPQEDYLATLTKHFVVKQVYPDSARLYGIEGDAIVSIQVDRQGNILYYRLLKAPGHPLLQDAVVDILKAASPVPTPPASFFGKNKVAEFMFPLAFRIGMNPESLVDIDNDFNTMISEISAKSEVKKH